MKSENVTKKLILWGATGHAKVLRECAIHNGYNLIALFDNNPAIISPFPDVSIYYGEKGFEKWLSEQRNHLKEIKCLIAIGGTRGKDRIKIQRYLDSKGIIATIVVHPTAFVAENVIIGKGSQVLVKSAVCVNAYLGESCIVNTGAIVDHDTMLGDGVHVGPGAHITGEVVIEKWSMIGAGATILPRTKIGENVIVGAGSVVTKDIGKNSIVYGNPARKKRTQPI